jgi:hypothetical protein
MGVVLLKISCWRLSRTSLDGVVYGLSYSYGASCPREESHPVQTPQSSTAYISNSVYRASASDI